MRKSQELKTGYEIYNPSNGRLSASLTQQRVLLDMVFMGFRKQESGYIDYAIKIASAHHLLNAVRFTAKIYPGLIKGFLKELLDIPDIADKFFIMNRVYLACRILDNVVDGDSPYRMTPDQILEYAQSTIEHFSEESWDDTNVVELFLKQALEVCYKIRFDVRKEILKVLESMEFDASRRTTFLKTGEHTFSSEEDINQNYYRLDIEGTCGACLELTGDGDTETNLKQVESLATAVRIYYDIRDLAKETRQGLVNITREDARKNKIEMDELVTWAQNGADLLKSPAGVKNWVIEQVKRGQQLLQRHAFIMEQTTLKPVTIMLLQKNYLYQCQTFFERIKLAEKQN